MLGVKVSACHIHFEHLNVVLEFNLHFARSLTLLFVFTVITSSWKLCVYLPTVSIYPRSYRIYYIFCEGAHKTAVYKTCKEFI